MNSSCLLLYESNLIFHVSAKPPLSSCFYRFWCSEWCSFKEVWFGGMVSCISDLQRAGVLFKLYRLSGKKNGNAKWTEKGRSYELFITSHLFVFTELESSINGNFECVNETRLKTNNLSEIFWTKTWRVL